MKRGKKRGEYTPEIAVVDGALFVLILLVLAGFAGMVEDRPTAKQQSRVVIQLPQLSELHSSQYGLNHKPG